MEANAKLAFRNLYVVECRDKDGRLKWVERTHNLVTNEGLDDVLSKYLKGSNYSAAWYVGLIDSVGYGAGPAAGDTAAQINGTNGWDECTAYTEGVRQTVTLGAVSGQSVDNTAAKAVFSINATKTIKGLFVASVSTKNSTSGVLYGAATFTDRALADGDTLTLTTVFTAANAA